MPLYEILVPLTHDFLWELRPFLNLFRRFWGDTQITVLGDQDPGAGVRFVRNRIPIPPGGWDVTFGANLVEYLTHDTTANLIVIMNGDYWLTAQTDLDALDKAAAYMTAHPEVIRLQLSNGMGLGRANTTIVEEMGSVAIGDGKFLYGSLLPAMWSRQLLIGHTPPRSHMWSFEVEMNEKIINSDMKSLVVVPTPITYEHCARTRINAVDLIPLPVELHAEVEPYIPAGFYIRRTP